MRKMFGDLNGQHGTHQVHFYDVPEGGTFHVSIASRLGNFLRGLFVHSELPQGHDCIQPGVPIDMIGGGYNSPYYPRDMKRDDDD